MYKKLFLMGTILFGFLCSVTLGGFDQKPQQEKMFNHAQDVNQFDVNPEINALRQARAEMVAAIQGAGNDTSKITAALAQYKNRENEIFNQLKARRRAQYANVRLEASRWGRATAKDKNHPGGPHKYTDVDLRIDSPASGEWVITPESVHWIEHCKHIEHAGGAEIQNPRVEGNGYTVHMRVKGPDYGHSPSIFEITLIAVYRYNDAALDKKALGDMGRLRERVEAALK